MLMVKLSKNEFEYLQQALFLPEKFRIMLSSQIKQHNDTYVLHISNSQADEIRDLCGEQLQIAGFDEYYEPTLEGKILESLIDKFYTG